MEVLGHVEFGEVLVAWALHEWQGRLRPLLPASAAQLSPQDTLFHAVLALLENRRNVIAGVVAAGITDCTRVRVTAADVPSILVMGADPVTNYSQNKLSERDKDGSADHVRALAASPRRIGGPFLAIARSTAGPITVFDGMHRMAAWVAHTNSGRQYPLEINLVVTERPSPVFELPASA
jgi:hypothetical protein